MDGFTVKSANRFLDTGSFKELQSLKIEPSDVQGIKQSEGPGKSFADTLSNAIQSVNQVQKDADVAAQNLATGRTDNVQDVMIAAEKADIALKVMVQVRNKIIDAYQEIMRMQV